MQKASDVVSGFYLRESWDFLAKKPSIVDLWSSNLFSYLFVFFAQQSPVAEPELMRVIERCIGEFTAPQTESRRLWS